jgi:hypothetical protein
MFPRLEGNSMNIPTNEQVAGAAAAGPAPAPAPGPIAAPQHVHADDHWPVCRCSHPMHPHKVELRRGVPLERYKCPRRRWWNQWRHPNVWQPPRR